MELEKYTLLSRKKVINSFRRHFSTWKYREFTIDRINSLLLISDVNHTSSYSFDLISTKIFPHNEHDEGTSGKGKDEYVLSLAHNNIEIMIKFDSLVSCYQWEEQLRSSITQGIPTRCRKYIQALDSLCCFIASQVRAVSMVEMCGLNDWLLWRGIMCVDHQHTCLSQPFMTIWLGKSHAEPQRVSQHVGTYDHLMILSRLILINFLSHREGALQKG